jgi:hypothetical protein
MSQQSSGKATLGVSLGSLSLLITLLTQCYQCQGAREQAAANREQNRKLHDEDARLERVGRESQRHSAELYFLDGL